MCKRASPVSRPSLIRDLSHVFTLVRVEKQSCGDKFVIWEEFMRPWNRKIGKTGYQNNSSETTLGGGAIASTAPPMDPPLAEQVYTRPAPGRPASAAQYAVDVKVLDHTSWCQSQSAQQRSEHVAIWCTTRIMLQ